MDWNAPFPRLTLSWKSTPNVPIMTLCLKSTSDINIFSRFNQIKDPKFKIG